MASVASSTASAAASRRVWGGIGSIFWLAFAYLLVLLALGVVYATPLAGLLGLTIPRVIGPIPIGVPWFGAVGAALLSLAGVFDHAHDWDASKRFWHLARPFVGATVAVVSVLIFQAAVLSVRVQPAADAGANNILYYLIAFLVGYREETFRELIKRLVDVVLAPGGGTAPTVRMASPDAGPVAGGTGVVVSGTSFTGATEVRFGLATASFRVDSDGQITATSPPGVAPGQVSISVTTKEGTAAGAVFTYQ